MKSIVDKHSVRTVAPYGRFQGVVDGTKWVLRNFGERYTQCVLDHGLQSIVVGTAIHVHTGENGECRVALKGLWTLWTLH